MPELAARVRLRDLGQTLGVAGRVVRNVITQPVERGSEVAIEWDSGDQLVFRDVDDKTGFHVAYK